jgi:hypothetical protein
VLDPAACRGRNPGVLGRLDRACQVLQLRRVRSRGPSSARRGARWGRFRTRSRASARAARARCSRGFRGGPMDHARNPGRTVTLDRSPHSMGA